MRQRRYYNKEFKSAAVYVARSGRSVNSVADALGDTPAHSPWVAQPELADQQYAMVSKMD